MPLHAPMLAGVLLFSLSALTAAQKDNGDECNCFRTNGSTVGYFAYHRFHDYRNVSVAATAPAALTGIANSTDAAVTSDFFATSQWTDDWSIQNWNNSASLGYGSDGGPTVFMVNSPNNVYIRSCPPSITPPPQSSTPG
jgi:hypothetical protein